MNREAFIKNSFQTQHITLSAEQVKAFGLYYEALLEGNRQCNLTAITDFKEVVRKHFLDSALAATCVDFSKIQTLVDVGSGAGFPGVPLKILYSHLNVLLVESLGKRVQFLESLSKTLNLSNVEVLKARAETAGRNEAYREKAELVVTRALSSLPVILEYATPLIKKGGFFLAYKGPKGTEEVQASRFAMATLNVSLEDIKRFSLPETNEERQVLIFKKTATTPEKYPRREGIPTKRPLQDAVHVSRETRTKHRPILYTLESSKKTLLNDSQPPL